MRKVYLAAIIAGLLISFPYSVRADIEALQPIQAKLSTLQLKAKEAQEKLMEYKKKLEDLATQARDVKNQAEGMKQGLEQVKTGDFSALDKMPKSISVDIGQGSGAMKDTEKVSDVIEDKVVPHTEGDNTVDRDKEAKEFIQEMMRDAVSTLYAAGLTTRTNMSKEVPHDVDMTAKDQIITEINMKAQECIERTAKIYTLESLIRTFQMIEDMQTVTYKPEKKEEE